MPDLSVALTSPKGRNGQMSLILHINGWSGSGKLTIGRIVAGRLGARLLDNHTLLNPAEALFEREDPLHGSLRRELRDIVFMYASQLSPSVSVVLTDALADNSRDKALFDDCRALARARSARLVAVVLDCDLDENVQRLTNERRADHRKLISPAVLRDLRSKYRLLRPGDVELIELDVTRLTAEAAASGIMNRLSV
jgi:gluconate kinase